MRRYLGVLAGMCIMAAGLSVTSGVPAIAQGALKPIAALIVNDTTTPVPVHVTNAPSTAPAIVRCVLELATASSTESPIIASASAQTLFLLKCPDGVTGIDAERVFFAPALGPEHSNATFWQFTIGLDADGDDQLDAPEVVSVLSSGSPTFTFLRPLRLEKTREVVLVFDYTASTGLASVPVTIERALIFEGVAVP